MNPLTREQILEDEFLREPLPGQRILSVGVFKLAQKLGLSFALPAAERSEISADSADLEVVASAWLLDARNDLAVLRRAADMGREDFFERIVKPYEFECGPERIALAKAELARTNAAVEAALYVVAPKPAGKDGPAPPGKS